MAVVLAPLLVTAALTEHGDVASSLDFPNQLKNFERSVYGDSKREDAGRDVEALSLSFFIALIFYLYVQGKRPRKDVRIWGQYAF